MKVILVELIEWILTGCVRQTDIFCLRERDLLSRFAAEVSAHEAQGQSKEYAFILVILHLSVCQCLALLHLPPRSLSILAYFFLLPTRVINLLKT